MLALELSSYSPHHANDGSLRPAVIQHTERYEKRESLVSREPYFNALPWRLAP